MLHNLLSKSVYGFWRLSLAHFYCLCWVFPRVERHMTSAEGTWGCSVALEPQLHTALCWESVWLHRWMPECWVKQDFFIFYLFFVSVVFVKRCIVLCATFRQRVHMVTAHRARLGSDSAGEPECWWFSYWLMSEKSLPNSCFVHKTESFSTSFAQALEAYAVWARWLFDEMNWIYHQTLSSACGMADWSQSNKPPSWPAPITLRSNQWGIIIQLRKRKTQMEIWTVGVSQLWLLFFLLLSSFIAGVYAVSVLTQDV